MSNRKLTNNIRLLDDFVDRIELYPYIPHYIEVYFSGTCTVEWAINRIEPDPIKVRDFFGSVYKNYNYINVTDMPFPLYNVISLVHGINKNCLDYMKEILI